LVRGMYSDCVMRGRLDRGPDVVAVRPSSSGWRLGEGAEASYGFSYDQRVRFGRAFIGIDSFGVSKEASDMVLEQDAVAAEQFARIADSLAAFDCQPTSAGQFI